jgi:hypothetical protein
VSSFHIIRILFYLDVVDRCFRVCDLRFKLKLGENEGWCELFGEINFLVGWLWILTWKFIENLVISKSLKAEHQTFKKNLDRNLLNMLIRQIHWNHLNGNASLIDWKNTSLKINIHKSTSWTRFNPPNNNNAIKYIKFDYIQPAFKKFLFFYTWPLSSYFCDAFIRCRCGCIHWKRNCIELAKNIAIVWIELKKWICDNLKKWLHWLFFIYNCSLEECKIVHECVCGNDMLNGRYSDLWVAAACQIYYMGWKMWSE